MNHLQLIIKAYNWVGYKYTDTDIEFMASALNNLLNTTWKRYKIKEVDYFITLGLNGVFGNFAGISMATLCQFETAYQKHDNVHYRKEYLRLNPPQEQHQLVSNTDTGKDEVVIDSIISKLRDNSASEADYNVWFRFLEQKSAVNDRSWQKFIYNKEDDYEPANERYLLELGKRKRFAESTYNLDLLSKINKKINDAEHDNPDTIEIEFWCKVLFFEELSLDSEKINKLEQFLKKKQS
jgi:hypothetical protein